MPSWDKVLTEVSGPHKGRLDSYRQDYATRLSEHTGRNVLVYFDGWLQYPGVTGVHFGIHDADKTGFMTCAHGMDRSKGLDLILHTPGGDVAATESIIDYLHSLYEGNIRAIVPQIAMSGGTLMALSCSEIVMGRQSSIGPVDPQIMGMPAQGILEEFNLAAEQIRADQSRIHLWQPIMSKYWPTLITSCQHAIDWSDELMGRYLSNCMFKDEDEAERDKKIQRISRLLGKQSESKSHNRHISPDQARDLGIKVTSLEEDNRLQDLVLTLHHALTITCQTTGSVKIIENQNGVSYVAKLQQPK